MDGWMVYSDGKKKGPFDTRFLQQMAASGMLKPSDQVWRQGLSDWAQAKVVADLSLFFEVGTPSPPPIKRKPKSFIGICIAAAIVVNIVIFSAIFLQPDHDFNEIKSTIAPYRLEARVAVNRIQSGGSPNTSVLASFVHKIPRSIDSRFPELSNKLTDLHNDIVEYNLGIKTKTTEQFRLLANKIESEFADFERLAKKAGF